MSRIGRAPIAVPAGVTVTIADGNVVTVKGPLGELKQTFSANLTIAKEGEAKTTFTDMNSENSGIIFDYIFVSSELKDSVETYYVCPAKVDGQWVSDHNAIVGTIVIRKA